MDFIEWTKVKLWLLISCDTQFNIPTIIASKIFDMDISMDKEFDNRINKFDSVRRYFQPYNSICIIFFRNYHS